jgi:hypothetical protein
LAAGRAFSQTEIDTFAITATGDSARFWMQLPSGYSAQHPPAILIWWHQLGGTQYELRDYTEFDTEANSRGWIAASHFGYSDRHWNTKRAQQHCQSMLDWIRERYPFNMDSIYMIGGSMGGAAGQVWHNNNCGDHDYLIAATAGGSQILDTQLRQEQYLESGDTNRSMRADFGGLPSERDSVAFEYHRASAICFADTTQSMHFNSLRLPVWSTWGNTDFESYAYGDPAQIWNALRVAGGADTTLLNETDAPCHGLQCMWPPGVCDWLMNFTANRYPDALSINADEDDEYYWTRVELAENDTVFGRYGAVKIPAEHRVDINLIRNIRRLYVNADVLNLRDTDTVRGNWQVQFSPADNVEIAFENLCPVRTVIGPNAQPAVWLYDSLAQTLHVAFEGNGNYAVILGVPEHPGPLPTSVRLVDAYPNPFNSETSLLIESSGGVSELTVYNVLGRVVQRFPVTLHAGTIRVMLELGNAASGILFVTVTGSTGDPLKMVLLR